MDITRFEMGDSRESRLRQALEQFLKIHNEVCSGMNIHSLRSGGYQINIDLDEGSEDRHLMKILAPFIHVPFNLDDEMWESANSAGKERQLSVTEQTLHGQETVAVETRAFVITEKKVAALLNRMNLDIENPSTASERAEADIRSAKLFNATSMIVAMLGNGEFSDQEQLSILEQARERISKGAARPFLVAQNMLLKSENE